MVQERLHTAEWAAVVVSSIGTIGLGATAGADPEPSDAKPLSKTRIAVIILMFTLLVVAGISTRLRNRTKPARRATRTSAVACRLVSQLLNPLSCQVLQLLLPFFALAGPMLS